MKSNHLSFSLRVLGGIALFTILSLVILSGCTKLDPAVTSRDHAETDVVKTPEPTIHEPSPPTVQLKQTLQCLLKLKHLFQL